MSGDNNPKRFSDEELLNLKKEVAMLSKRLDDHIELEEKKFDSMIEAVRDNTKSITNLTNETRAIIALHRDLSGAARVGKGIQSFLIWVVKWGAIGVGIASGINWIVKIGAGMNG
jgi:hypothetical protein